MEKEGDIMSFRFVKQLPTPDEVKEQVPVSEALKKVKEKRDREIQAVFTLSLIHILIRLLLQHLCCLEQCLLLLHEIFLNHLFSVVRPVSSDHLCKRELCT